MGTYVTEISTFALLALRAVAESIHLVEKSSVKRQNELLRVAPFDSTLKISLGNDLNGSLHLNLVT